MHGLTAANSSYTYHVKLCLLAVWFLVFVTYIVTTLSVVLEIYENVVLIMCIYVA